MNINFTETVFVDEQQKTCFSILLVYMYINMNERMNRNDVISSSDEKV